MAVLQNLVPFLFSLLSREYGFTIYVEYVHANLPSPGKECHGARRADGPFLPAPVLYNPMGYHRLFRPILEFAKKPRILVRRGENITRNPLRRLEREEDGNVGWWDGISSRGGRGQRTYARIRRCSSAATTQRTRFWLCASGRIGRKHRTRKSLRGNYLLPPYPSVILRGREKN